jgi:nucleoside-diphosphate-sugar epimerase
MFAPAFLLIFGLGYSAAAIAEQARARGFTVVGTKRNATENPDVIGFSEAGRYLPRVTHVLSSVPPDAEGDPVLSQYGDALAAAPALRWVGYLSTTGVYGNRDGAWVDETTPTRPDSERGRKRVAAEAAWGAFAARVDVDIFRLAGIYGPGRSVFDDLRAGRARRVIKPGHAFGRIHRDDIVAAVLAAMGQARPAGPPRILNLTDDWPAESAEVITEAAAMLGMAPPPAIPFAQAVETMSPMARSFWADHRRVSSEATQKTLGITWRYPTYREGLWAILQEERLHGVTQQSEVGGA